MEVTLENIWYKFAAKLRHFIQSKVSDPATSEDILQDVFVKIQNGLDRLQDKSKLRSWIYLITRNAIIDHYRTRKEMVEITESLPAEAATVEGDVGELTTSFLQMIYSLPEPYREALVLTEFEGMTQKQLALKAEISLSGAKSRVQRAREMLRQMLHECCTFEFDRRGAVIDCEPRTNASCADYA